MKNTIICLRSALIVTLATLIYSCRTDDPIKPDLNRLNPQEMTLLGKKLEIPFTVENMQKAYDNLVQNTSVNPQGRTDGLDEDLIVEASHYYYRFLPNDSAEFETLQQDTVLDVSNIPFEYEIDSMMAYYQNPELVGRSDYTWYYSVLPVDYEFSQTIEHQKLEDLYFPPEDAEGSLVNETSLGTARLGNDFYDIWETEALRITGNLDEEDQASLAYLANGKVNYSANSNSRIQGRKWNPSGTITVEEGVLTGINSNNNIVGVAGAEIKIRKWGFLVIKKTRTNQNGYYKAGSIRTKYVKYAIYFNYPFFKVMAGTVLWPAYYRSTTKYKRKGWTRTFYEGGHTHFYSLVQNAAYDYHMNVVPIYGLKRPRYCKISAKYSACKSSQHRSEIVTLLPVSEIRISRKNEDCDYRESDGIYATTIHELTHASHRELDVGMFSVIGFNDCSKTLLMESWAEGVETIVTSDRYWALDTRYLATTRGNTTNLRLWNDSRQTDEVGDMNEYTPIVADLHDYINQNALTNVPRNQPVDRVSGYRLNEIQAALDDCRNINCWENNLRNKFQKSTEGNLTELFDYVREVRQSLSSPCN